MRSPNRADIFDGKTAIEVKKNLDAVSALRSSLMQLAYFLSSRELYNKGLLVLVDPKISQERLTDEWKHAERTLNPQVFRQLHLVLYRDGSFQGLPDGLDPKIRKNLALLVHQEMGRQTRIPRATIYYELLKVLVHQWLLKKGPMTAHWLAETVGCSYPTVADALAKLGSSIKRHSDRRIELGYFPKEEWASLVAVSGSARSTMRFIDRSGQSRDPGSLFRRAQGLKRPDIAIAGVFGAKHYFPKLDLVGSPRLDISIHCPNGMADIGFIEKLDPALQPTRDSQEGAMVFLHFVRREESLFEKDAEGFYWADPVECLLDLHAGRLESQALEFLQFYERSRSVKSKTQ